MAATTAAQVHHGGDSFQQNNQLFWMGDSMNAFTLPEKDKWNTTKSIPYDASMAAYLGLIFDPSRAAIDVGANVGKIACFLASRMTAKVICFEPAPATITSLRTNVQDFPNIEVRQLALSNASGREQFVGDGTVTAHLSAGRRSATSIEVEVSTLDEAIDPDLDVGLIKIDVEGDELRVLEGSVKTIKKWNPLLAVQVIPSNLRRTGTSRKRLFDFVATLGYQRAVNKFGMNEGPRKSTGADDIFFIPNGWPSPRLFLSYRKLVIDLEARGPSLDAVEVDGQAFLFKTTQ